MALTILMVATGWSANVVAANPAPAASNSTEALLKDIEQAGWISEGNGPHVVYVFFDANCPYCHQLYVNTRSWVKQGKLQLRWIPTSTLTTTSKGKAAAMLGAKDPLKAFYQNEDNYSQGGGIEEDLASAEVEKKLASNDALLARTPSGVVPTMLYRAADGTPMLVVGSPPPDKLKAMFSHVK